MKFDLFLFTTDRDTVGAAVDAGVDGFIVDWEQLGKERRQESADTQINHDTPDDLKRMRSWTSARILCRINGFGPHTAAEVEQAIDCGADEVFLPMVREPAQVEKVLELVRDRCGVAILIETVDAVREAARLGRLPLSRIYMGLNDLGIDRGTPNIFTAAADGTVEAVRRLVGVPFGFAGLTNPSLGHPIPCRLLLSEMMRLECGFTFLRRAFLRDAARDGLAETVLAIRRGIEELRSQSPSAAESNRLLLAQHVMAWHPAVAR